MQQLLAVLGMVAFGLGVPPPDSASESFDRRAVVARVADLLDEMYVDPRIGKDLAAHLRRRQAQGAFDDCAGPAALADAVTRAMREIADDKHLSVRYGKEPGTAPGAIRIERPASAGSEAPGRRIVVAPGEGPRATKEGERERGPGRSGVARVERLEGNVGYLALSGFPPGDRNRDAVASAMNVLEDTDALVIDVARCPGGAPAAVLFLESYFFAPEPKEMIARYDRPMDRTEHDSTLRELPGKRRPDVPLFIVAGAGTGSACESFAYTLQKHGRAIVVGERTAGAGYNNVLMQAGEGFTVSISVARPIHPKTGRGWEGTGVEPDVLAAAGRAVSTAHREALKTLLAKASRERRRALEWALESSRARETGVKESAALEAYAGRYGAREIGVSDGALFYRSAGGRSFGPLLPLGAGRFLAGEELCLTFERGGGAGVSAVSVERSDGQAERFEKRGSEPSPEAPCSSEKGQRP